MARTEQHNRLQAFIDRELAKIPGPLVALDAGCGSIRRFDVPADTAVWGLDISQGSLDARTDLAERIVGSVEDPVLPPAKFDMIASWDVLEHVDDPIAALDNLARGLKPGGLLVLANPHPWGLKSTIAKLTPFWFHKLFLLRFVPLVVGQCLNSSPFPTYMRWSMAPKQFIREASRRGLQRVYFEAYEATSQRRLREKLRLTGPVWTLIRGAWRVASLGRADAEHTELMLVLQRPQASVGRSKKPLTIPRQDRPYAVAQGKLQTERQRYAT